MICKLKARVNINGVLNVESGYYVEEQEVEEEIKEEGEKKDADVSTLKSYEAAISAGEDFSYTDRLSPRDSKRRKTTDDVLDPPSERMGKNLQREKLTSD